MRIRRSARGRRGRTSRAGAAAPAAGRERATHERAARWQVHGQRSRSQRGRAALGVLRAPARARHGIRRGWAVRRGARDIAERDERMARSARRPRSIATRPKRCGTRATRSSRRKCGARSCRAIPRRRPRASNRRGRAPSRPTTPTTSGSSATSAACLPAPSLGGEKTSRRCSRA